MASVNKKTLGIIGVLVLLALVGLHYFLQEEVKVKTAEASLKDITQSISYSGSIESARRVKISSEIAGRVVEVLFTELDEVEEGQVLIRLDDSELKAQLTQAGEALNQAKINLFNARKNLIRIKQLFEKGFASREQLDTAQQAVDVGDALVKQHQSSYEVLETRLAYTTIKAPLRGTVVSKNVSVGEIVAGPLAGGGLGIPMVMAEIADLNKLEVHVNVDEVDVGKIKVGQRADITVDALPERTFPGTVEEIALMNTGRREVGITYRVRVAMENPEGMLKLGMTANVNFILKSKQDVLAVPKGALLLQGDRKVVFTVSDERVVVNEVTTGIEGEEFIEITSGLSPGDKVVVGIVPASARGGKQVGQFTAWGDNLTLQGGQRVVVVP